MNNFLCKCFDNLAAVAKQSKGQGRHQLFMTSVTTQLLFFK